jgi:hypothetical protein
MHDELPHRDARLFVKDTRDALWMREDIRQRDLVLFPIDGLKRG